MLPLALLTLVCVVTYTFEIVFGIAGTIMMLALMSFFYDARTLVIYSVLPQILVAEPTHETVHLGLELQQHGRPRTDRHGYG